MAHELESYVDARVNNVYRPRMVPDMLIDLSCILELGYEYEAGSDGDPITLFEVLKEIKECISTRE